MGGGQVLGTRPSPDSPLRLQIPPTAQGYADAQLDDYGLPHIKRRADYPWQPGLTLRLRGRFSHDDGRLLGTAGFGFWNAPFGDPTVRWPALPQAVWFFYASVPNDLPLASPGPGRGWFAATLDATTPSALKLIPLAPFVLLGNQSKRFRNRWWPWVQHRLGISFAPISVPMTEWHEYYLAWGAGGCEFAVDGRILLQTPHSPRGPLGFVCWIDNQYMVLTADGRMGAGVLAVPEPQWLEVSDLDISPGSNYPITSSQLI